MARLLGEGNITKITKSYATISVERVGAVKFPIAAVLFNKDCLDLRVLHDLRELFQSGDEVIFSALKNKEHNTVSYTASSVVKRRDLITCSGKVVEICQKYCYVDAKKYGRVFLPFSARVANSTRLWFGKGAEVGKQLTLKIFHQPEISGCRYVAWSVSSDEPQVSARLQLQPAGRSQQQNNLVLSYPFACNGGEPSTDADMASIARDSMKQLAIFCQRLIGTDIQDDVFVKQAFQVGVIVFVPKGGRDGRIYSAQSGLACLPLSSYEPWMELGRFVRYQINRNHRKTENDKVHWVVTDNFFDLGFLFKVIDDPDDEKLILELPTVVNCVNYSMRQCQLWNDFIGRVAVYSKFFNDEMRPFDAVRVRAVFRKFNEECPWGTAELDMIGEDEEVLESSAQLLFTSDNWEVKYVSDASPYYGFMHSSKYGAAYFTQADVNTSSEVRMCAGVICRASVWFQQKEQKHNWRAVLVSPLDKKNKNLGLHPKREPAAPPKGPIAIPQGLLDPTAKRTQPSPAKMLSQSTSSQPSSSQPSSSLSSPSSSSPAEPSCPWSQPSTSSSVATTVIPSASFFGVIGSGRRKSSSSSVSQISPPLPTLPDTFSSLDAEIADLPKLKLGNDNAFGCSYFPLKSNSREFLAWAPSLQEVAAQSRFCPTTTDESNDASKNFLLDSSGFQSNGVEPRTVHDRNECQSLLRELMNLSDVHKALRNHPDLYKRISAVTFDCK